MGKVKTTSELFEGGGVRSYEVDPNTKQLTYNNHRTTWKNAGVIPDIEPLTIFLNRVKIAKYIEGPTSSRGKPYSDSSKKTHFTALTNFMKMAGPQIDNKIEELKSQIKELKSQIKELKTNKFKLGSEIKGLKNKNKIASLNDQIKSLNDQIKSINEQIAKIEAIDKSEINAMADKYSDISTEYSKIDEESYLDGDRLSQNRKDNYLTYQAILDKIKELSAKNPSDEQGKFKNHMDILLLKLYALQPPIRAEISERPAEKGKEALRKGMKFHVMDNDKLPTESGNYLLIHTDQTTSYYMNEFKTASSHNKRIIRHQSGELSKTIITSLEKYKRTFVITQGLENDKSITYAQLNKTLAQHFGKGNSIDSLRSAYVTHFFTEKLSPRDKRLMASSMLTSVKELGDVYKKLIEVPVTPSTKTVEPSKPAKIFPNKQKEEIPYTPPKIRQKNQEYSRVEYQKRYYNENKDYITNKKRYQYETDENLRSKLAKYKILYRLMVEGRNVRQETLDKNGITKEDIANFRKSD